LERTSHGVTPLVKWAPTPDAGGIGAFEHYYTLGDMIAAGRAMNELLRSTDLVQMANWAQTVNVIAVPAPKPLLTMRV
jgi:alpha-L-arabinofuranosidase